MVLRPRPPARAPPCRLRGASHAPSRGAGAKVRSGAAAEEEVTHAAPRHRQAGGGGARAAPGRVPPPRRSRPWSQSRGPVWGLTTERTGASMKRRGGKIHEACVRSRRRSSAGLWMQHTGRKHRRGPDPHLRRNRRPHVPSGPGLHLRSLLPGRTSGLRRNLRRSVRPGGARGDAMPNRRLFRRALFGSGPGERMHLAARVRVLPHRDMRAASQRRMRVDDDAWAGGLPRLRQCRRSLKVRPPPAGPRPTEPRGPPRACEADRHRRAIGSRPATTRRDRGARAGPTRDPAGVPRGPSAAGGLRGPPAGMDRKLPRGPVPRLSGRLEPAGRRRRWRDRDAA